MAELLLRIIGDDADALARRLAGDINASAPEAEAGLERRAAQPGEKGPIEVIGGLLVTVLGSAAVEPLVGLIRDLVSRAPGGSHQREIELTTPDGAVLTLHGRMSDADFAAVADRILRLLEGGGDAAP
jgi:hypothetical protein